MAGSISDRKGHNRAVGGFVFSGGKKPLALLFVGAAIMTMLVAASMFWFGPMAIPEVKPNGDGSGGAGAGIPDILASSKHRTASSLQAAAAAAAAARRKIERERLAELDGAMRREARQSYPSCRFRKYPPHRYYHADVPIAEQPDFLKANSVEYIFGRWPAVLPVSAGTGSAGRRQKQPSGPAVHKLCVDQDEWLKHNKEPVSAFWEDQSELPFADGTNPSILSVENLRKRLPPSNPDATLIRERYPSAAWLATACMTNSQCNWKDPPKAAREFHLSKKEKPDTVRTILFLLDANFRKVAETTILLEQDAPWGRRVKAKPVKTDLVSGENQFERSVRAFDDARLFLHADRVWISYREGPGFGFESQVLNPLHLGVSVSHAPAQRNNDDNSAVFQAIVKASETSSFCCGRNMALMEHLTDKSRLQSLTWVDPVTVVDVDITPHVVLKQQQEEKKRRLTAAATPTGTSSRESPGSILPPRTEENDQRSNNWDATTLDGNSSASGEITTTRRRRLSSASDKKRKSHIHGTSAFLVHLPATKEFLGVGHFHRPSDRDFNNEYARFGHHYTHTFFTVSDAPPHRLMRLSPEWILPSAFSVHWSEGARVTDGEIIQFCSGLDLTDGGRTAVLAYGINDCEAAVTTLEMDEVNAMLEPVDGGDKQVVDYMRPLVVS